MILIRCDACDSEAEIPRNHNTTYALEYPGGMQVKQAENLITDLCPNCAQAVKYGARNSLRAQIREAVQQAPVAPLSPGKRVTHELGRGIEDE